ncbi:MAG: CTP synthase, partial [Treponema sp.]|nr:CTP synthase [Treponema sp.]
WEDADSAELNPNTKRAVISLLEQSSGLKTEGRGRLGKYSSAAEPGTKFLAAYGDKIVSERHRHKYEFSNQYREDMVQSGLVIGAVYPEKDLVDCVEWPSAGKHNHPWGVGVQFHPEFKSKPTAAGPLFRDFIAVCRDLKAGKK